MLKCWILSKVDCCSIVLFLALAASTIRSCQGLLMQEETKIWSCLEGWVGEEGEIPEGMLEHMKQCGMDKTTPPECKKHCLTKKLGLILDGRIWLYKLVLVLKQYYPGPAGKESVDKMTDIILECSDRHFKQYGLLSPYHCSKEKKMWNCVLQAIETFCQPEQPRRTNEFRPEAENDEGPKRHQDILVENGKHYHENPSGGGEEFLSSGKQKVLLMDY